MKIKQIISAACAMSIVGVMGVTASFAATDNTASTKPAITEKGERPERKELTDEQKAEMEAKRAEMKTKAEANEAKWAALTDSQKEEVYALQEDSIDNQIEILDKYLQWGLIDETAATEMKAKLTEQKSSLRENGKMSGFGGGMGFRPDGQGGREGKGPQGTPPSTTDSTISE